MTNFPGKGSRQTGRTKNRFLAAIEAWLQKLDVEEEWLYRHFGVSRSYFRSAKNNFPKDPIHQKPFTLDFVRSIVMCTGIPPETFLLTNEELDRL